VFIRSATGGSPALAGLDRRTPRRDFAAQQAECRFLGGISPPITICGGTAEPPCAPATTARENAIMSVVKINVLTVPEPMRAELERRFAGRAGLVENADGFEGFELLRPVAGSDRYLVYTRWRSEEDFQRWTESQSFQKGHEQAAADAARNQGEGQGHGHGHGGPASSAAELWSFEVIERVAPQT
jgi:heme-degrading monooxygenase HmoA